MINFKDFLNESALTKGEIEKYSWRFDVFKEKVNSQSPFELEKPEKYNGLTTVTLDKSQFSRLDSVDDIPKNLKVLELENTIPLGDLKKSKEFGGQGTQGNKGNQYERDFTKDLENYFINGKIGEVTDKQAMKEIEHICGKIVSVREDGALNQKRPLRFKSGRIIVGDGKLNIGSTVTDITVTNDSGKEFYLSLKHGSTVTFVNAGVATILSQKDMEDGRIDDKDGQTLLDMLGLNNERFVAIFNNYVGDCKAKERLNVTNDVDKTKLLTFMSTVIGYGYILVHKNGSHTHILDMNKDTLRDFLTINKVEVIYPLDGCAKRVDVNIDMKGLDIKVNIRNKNGKIYPSNIMADYKIH